MDISEEEDETFIDDDNPVLVMPGDVITQEQGFLRGHGTYIGTPYHVSAARSTTTEVGQALSTDKTTPTHATSLNEDPESDPEEGGATERDGKALLSSVAGIVMRVNKLISVAPLKSRYTGDIGDIVVGRVVEVGNKRWKVDIRGRQSATLQLGSINLPGGALRRRTLQDRLQMRSLFAENDLVSAEVASFYQDGGVAIHTRSMRYGKLENGQLVTVSPSLVQRVKQHFVRLPCGVNVILAHNGNLWLSVEAEQVDTEQSRMSEQMEEKKSRHREREYSFAERQAMARVRNAIVSLCAAGKQISPQAITRVYQESLAKNIEPKTMLGLGV